MVYLPQTPKCRGYYFILINCVFNYKKCNYFNKEKYVPAEYQNNNIKKIHKFHFSNTLGFSLRLWTRMQLSPFKYILKLTLGWFSVECEMLSWENSGKLLYSNRALKRLETAVDFSYQTTTNNAIPLLRTNLWLLTKIFTQKHQFHHFKVVKLSCSKSLKSIW